MAINNSNTLSLNAASTNIPTGSYVQLASASPIKTNRIIIANATSSIIRFGYGVAGSETGYVCVAAGSTASVEIGLNVIPLGTRLALQAVDTAATTGYVAVSFLP